eukprot:SAG31_NODE_2256_length_6072_cov_9.043529_2_plen_134_part_00
MDSRFMGSLLPGEVVEVTETVVLDTGITRLKCTRGWFSDERHTAGGTARTRLVEAGTICYQLLSDALLRKSADTSSELVEGRLSADQVVLALETRFVETDGGDEVLRVHTTRGWCSATAQDGTPLLAAMTAGN